MTADSRTPFKDELIRIAAVLGLPDDVEPTAVAEAVQALKREAGATADTLSGVQRMLTFQTERADGFKLGLEDAATAMEKARDDLRMKEGADLIAARSTIIRIAGDLNQAAALADTALEEPIPPEPDDAD